MSDIEGLVYHQLQQLNKNAKSCYIDEISLNFNFLGCGVWDEISQLLLGIIFDGCFELGQGFGEVGYEVNPFWKSEGSLQKNFSCQMKIIVYLNMLCNLTSIQVLYSWALVEIVGIFVHILI